MRTGASSRARAGVRASTADRMAVSSAVPGRGGDERRPDVTVIEPYDMGGAAGRTTDVSPQRRSSDPSVLPRVVHPLTWRHAPARS
jgi:hypothetical protein